MQPISNWAAPLRPGPALAAIPAPPVRAAFLDHHAINLKKCWDEGRYAHLLDLVEDGEQKKSPEPAASRLAKKNERSWRLDSMILLGQREPKFIASFLDRTLPQRFIRGEFGNRLPTIRRHDPNGPLQPMIYANMVADVDGCGLTCDEFELCLTAMEVGVGAKIDPGGNRTTTRNGQSVYQGVDAKYAGLKPNATKTFWQSAHFNRLRDKVVTFARVNRTTLTLARASNIDHIMFQPEIGWGYKGYNRLHDHKNLNESSPDTFRYLQLVLQHLFAARRFRLHQFVLFDVLNEVQAGVGEALGSQLGQSYIGFGGVNFEQAGKSDASGWKMAAREWYGWRLAIDTPIYRQCLENNFKVMTDRIDARIDMYRSAVELHEKEEELAQARTDFADTTQRLESATYQAQLEVKMYDSELADLAARVVADNKVEELLAAFDADQHQLAVDEGLIVPGSFPD